MKVANNRSMIRLILISFILLGTCVSNSQSLPAEDFTKAAKNKSYWAFELKEATVISDSSKIALFNIENYLDVLQPDSVQFILDSISGLSWVVYPVSKKPESGIGLITLPAELHRIYPNKLAE